MRKGDQDWVFEKVSRDMRKCGVSAERALGALKDVIRYTFQYRDDAGRGGVRDVDFGVDLEWTPSWVLYSWERGNMDRELFEVSADEAERIVKRIRRTAAK